MIPETYSDVCVSIVKKFEGLHKVMDDGRIRSYRCPAGRWTIGYGHTKGVRSNMHIDEAQAEEFLRQDLEEFAQVVQRHVEVPLTQNQFDALVSWVFNLGEGNFLSSTMLKKLNQGKYEEVPGEMMRWNKARVKGELKALRGLTRRRSAEAGIFAADEKLPSDPGEKPGPQKVSAASTKKPLRKSRTIFGAGLAAVSSVVGAISENVEGYITAIEGTASEIKALIPYIPSLEYVFVGLTLAGAALAIYARWDDHRKGRN